MSSEPQTSSVPNPSRTLSLVVSKRRAEGGANSPLRYGGTCSAETYADSKEAFSKHIYQQCSQDAGADGLPRPPRLRHKV